MRSMRVARCPLAITAVPPQFIAISAASSFVFMPPRPLAEGPAASAFSSGVISSTSGITSRTWPFDATRRCLAQQAIHVRQKHQRVASSPLITSAARRSLSLKCGVRDTLGDGLEFGGGNRVVFVDDRQHAEAQQLFHRLDADSNSAASS